MKTLLSLFALAIATSLSITSCSEEEIKPQTELMNGGGEGTQGIGR